MNFHFFFFVMYKSLYLLNVLFGKTKQQTHVLV